VCVCVDKDSDFLCAVVVWEIKNRIFNAVRHSATLFSAQQNRNLAFLVLLKFAY